MKNFVQEGKVLTVTNGTGSTILSGVGIKIGTRIGVVLQDLAAGASGQAIVDGVIQHAKATGASTGGAQGVDAYWDDTAKVFTAVSSANTKAGYFAELCANGDLTCKIALNR